MALRIVDDSSILDSGHLPNLRGISHHPASDTIREPFESCLDSVLALEAVKENIELQQPHRSDERRHHQIRRVHRHRARDPSLGYATDIVEMIGRNLPEIRRQGIRVVTNAGGVHPEAAALAEHTTTVPAHGVLRRYASILRWMLTAPRRTGSLFTT